jgi:hypothetical protein
MTTPRHQFVFGAAVLLMILRVDIWWWGDAMRPVLFGWLTVPMLYQLAIWVCGWLLVLYSTDRLWSDPE